MQGRFRIENYHTCNGDLRMVNNGRLTCFIMDHKSDSWQVEVNNHDMCSIIISIQLVNIGNIDWNHKPAVDKSYDSTSCFQLYSLSTARLWLWIIIAAVPGNQLLRLSGRGTDLCRTSGRRGTVAVLT